MTLRLKRKIIFLIGMISFSLGFLFLFQNAVSILPVAIFDVSREVRVVGNGVVDDREAVLDIFKNFINADNSNPSRVKLMKFGSNKAYYLMRPLNPGNAENQNKRSAIFEVDNQHNLVIDGNGSILYLDHFDEAFKITNSRNIVIKNFKIDYKKPTFTQGTVINIPAKDGYIDIKVDDGYIIPDVNNIGELFSKAPNSNRVPFGNSATFDGAGHYLKDINVFIKAVRNKGSGNLRIAAENEIKYLQDLMKIKKGFKFAFRTYGSINSRLFRLDSNTDVRIENIKAYALMTGGILATNNNGGNIRIDGFQAIRKPGSSRLLVGLGDAIHVTGNRAKVTIQNCFIERMLDDGININAMAEVSPQILSSTEFDLRSTSFGRISPNLKSGDTISAFNLDPKSREPVFLGTAKIDSVTAVDTANPVTSDRVRRIKIDKPFANVASPDDLHAISDREDLNSGGSNFDDFGATRFFIREISNPGFVIIDNTFQDKPRNGILAPGFNGLMRSNRFHNLSGSGIASINNLNFNEGPYPENLEISANIFSDVLGPVVLLGLSTLSSLSIDNGRLPIYTTIANNSFERSTQMDILIKNVSLVNISGNTSDQEDSKSVQALNSSFANSIKVSSLFKIKEDDSIYFSTTTTVCKYKSMNDFKFIFDNEQIVNLYLTRFNRMPVGRYNSGYCKPYEGVFRVNTTIYQGQSDGSVCRFSEMSEYKMLTGFPDGVLLKTFDTLPSELIDRGPCRTVNSFLK